MRPWFAHHPVLRGELCTLRPFTEDDIAAMGPILADPDVNRLTGSAHSSAEIARLSPELDERTLTWYRTRNVQTDRLDLAVVDRRSEACVGEVVLNDVSEPDLRCNFRILLGPEGRGRGIGSEATRLVLDHAFATTPVNRIGLDVYSFNPAARRAYEKAGFVVEGVLREELIFDGEAIDSVLMSVLRSDRG